MNKMILSFLMIGLYVNTVFSMREDDGRFTTPPRRIVQQEVTPAAQALGTFAPARGYAKPLSKTVQAKALSDREVKVCTENREDAAFVREYREKRGFLPR